MKKNIRKMKAETKLLPMQSCVSSWYYKKKTQNDEKSFPICKGLSPP